MKENPLSKADSDKVDSVSDIISFQRLSFFEKIGVISSLIMSILILIVSGVSFTIDLGRMNIVNIIVDLLLAIMCLTSLYFIYGIYRKKVIVENLIDEAFQEGIYDRLKPLIENIANSRVDADIILDRLSNMDIKIENILNEQTSKTKSYGINMETEMRRDVMLGTSLGFIFKSIFMLLLTMAVFMFLVNFNLGRLTPYVTLSMFVLGWLFITGEYFLWKNTTAWLFIAFPIIMIPVSVLIIGNIVNYNILMAILYASIFIYTGIYYIWAIYVTTGAIPFIRKRIDEDINDKFFSLRQKGIIEDVWTEVKKKS